MKFINGQLYPRQRVLVELEYENETAICCSVETEKDNECDYHWKCNKCGETYIGPLLTRA